MIPKLTLALFFLAIASGSIAAEEPSFSAPGDLARGSGRGVTDPNVYYSGIRFPLEKGPAFLNSQVYGKGGSNGPTGGQCDESNYSYPWRDNFCESRTWDMRICPSGKGHQGQDIRPATCTAKVHWVVAVEDGFIAQIGTYSVTLQSANGTLYRYLHLQMDDLAVRELDKVKRGERIGKVSNDYPGSSTTIHLHFDIKDSVIVGSKKIIAFVPPYSSLVESYKRLTKGQP